MVYIGIAMLSLAVIAVGYTLYSARAKPVPIVSALTSSRSAENTLPISIAFPSRCEKGTIRVKFRETPITVSVSAEYKPKFWFSKAQDCLAFAELTPPTIKVVLPLKSSNNRGSPEGPDQRYIFDESSNPHRPVQYVDRFDPQAYVPSDVGIEVEIDQ